MQLVLDDQVGRWQRPGERRSLLRLGGAEEAVGVIAVGAAEQRTGRPEPGQRRELVDSGDQERRQPPVQRLVDGDDRQRALAVEIAVQIGADDPQLARVI